ncbi:AprI/Inh family metalloprotease inhibitor [Rhizobium leguminosarum]|uniref:AprI/Inh family metalloprotease inhibitor n=1 Tax=Rhizobium leguminosarum TaxID=384 RepID=A0A7K3VTA1_RHILE|nr:AprI/Inh family metalloprotease inhibitor [Rhizobium leguminosarum]NEK34318.1 AprI/Inh family metalloprotease inhibitor [Rhizobium leguminosarum]
MSKEICGQLLKHTDRTGGLSLRVRGLGWVVFAVYLAASASGHLSAQEVGEAIVDATIGEWLIASEDGSVGCHIILGKDKTIGGRVVTEGKTCEAPWHDEIAAWGFSDPGIVLRDATRKQLVGFQEREGGPWKTPLNVSPVIYFIRSPNRLIGSRLPRPPTASGF